MLKPICFYLPQFHPIKENDEWWGKGFTEWRNVAKAVPNFVGHYQPHVPSELGFYDLRLPEVQKRQADLAREYGVYGFCFYYYWFAGRRVLEHPLNQFFEHKEIDFPYCVCWANENWTRTWDGKERDILLGQNHSPEDDEAFIRSLIPLFKDERYIKVNGKPLLAVYRVDLFPDAKATAARWRKVAEQEGLPGLHLCAVQFYGIDDPRQWGFDAAIEFPPHKFIGPENRPDVMPQMTNPKFAGGIVDYEKVVAQSLAKPIPDYTWYRGVMPSWDNTARRQDTPHMFINSSPLEYQHWLRRIGEQTRKMRGEEDQFIFINAWNEWAEGCHLEPDLKYGRQWLEATHAALKDFSGIDTLLAGLQSASGVDPKVRAEIVEAFDARERSLYALQDVIRKKNVELNELRAKVDAGTPPKQALMNVAKQELNKFPKVKKGLKKILRREK